MIYCGRASLQWNLGQRNDGDEDDNDDRDGVWIASGHQYVGRDFIADLLTEHEETCDSDSDVKYVLRR